jgi:hypothetical protein
VVEQIYDYLWNADIIDVCAWHDECIITLYRKIKTCIYIFGNL